jgi:hypothetical protein
MSRLVVHEDAVRELPATISEMFRLKASRCDLLGTVLLLGEDNPVSSEPEFQLYSRPNNCAGHRLQERVLELPESEYLAIWRSNLCTPRWNQEQAMKRVWVLLGDIAPWSTIVLLGRKVADTFSVSCRLQGRMIPFDTASIDTGGRMFRLIALPHPSGRCQAWNDPANYVRAQRLMNHEVPGMKCGGVLL